MSVIGFDAGFKLSMHKHILTCFAFCINFFIILYSCVVNPINSSIYIIEFFIKSTLSIFCAR